MPTIDTLFDELSKGLPELIADIKYLDGVIRTSDRTIRREAIKDFESKGYFVAQFNPLYVFGKETDLGDLSARLIICEINNPAKCEVRLTHRFVPEGYTVHELLAPDGIEMNNYDLRCAQDTIVEYFKKTFGLYLSFADKQITLARNIRYNTSLAGKARSFQKSAAKAKTELAEIKERRAKILNTKYTK